MRVTQDVTSYVILFLLLIGGVAFMVLFLIQDGPAAAILHVATEFLVPNFIVLGALGSMLVVIAFYLLLKIRVTV